VVVAAVAVAAVEADVAVVVVVADELPAKTDNFFSH
jgi:hypothetical protein